MTAYAEYDATMMRAVVAECAFGTPKSMNNNVGKTTVETEKAGKRTSSTVAIHTCRPKILAFVIARIPR
jgi:hypothetical protein